MKNSLRISLIQLNVCRDKVKNVENAVKQIRKAVELNNSKIVVLPESFNTVYSTKYFAENAELIPNGYTSVQLANLAAELKIYIVGGSLPERDPTDAKIIYNTCPIFAPDGQLIGRHRKVHMFDCDIPQIYEFKESNAFTPGNDITIIEINNNKIGICICADNCFTEFIKLYRQSNCKLLIIPSAYPENIGQLNYWNLFNCMRALENHMYIASVSPAKDINSEFIAYGYSMFVDPFGAIIDQAQTDETIVSAEIDFDIEIPMFSTRRPDLYEKIENRITNV